jgi:hypothetical protein
MQAFSFISLQIKKYISIKMFASIKCGHMLTLFTLMPVLILFTMIKLQLLVDGVLITVKNALPRPFAINALIISPSPIPMMLVYAILPLSLGCASTLQHPQ